jgi:hypothetical protein
VVIFPDEPVISAPADVCAGTAFTLPSVTAVAGFTVQYSINGGAYTASPVIPTAAGTYTVKARYVLTSACGGTAAGAAAPAGCLESNTVNAVVDPVPTATPTTQLYTCDGTGLLTATGITSGATVSWQYVSGPANPTGTTTSNPLLVTFTSAGTANYNLLVSRGACNNINVGSASLVLPATSSVNIASTASCGYCVVTDGNTRSFFNSSGQIIARIQDDGLVTPTQLGLTEVCVRMDGTVQSILDNLGYQQPYLQRQWTVDPATSTNAIVTLYFTNAELTALQSAANPTRYQFSGYGLWVSKYAGGGGGTFTPPCTGGTPGCGQVTAEYVPASFSAYGSNHQVEFSVSNFSTFYIHPALFPFTPLPVELVSFIGWNQGSVNRLQWKTASEQNTEKFEVMKSTNGTDWEKIGEKIAAGNSTQPLTYDFTDNLPVTGNNYYKLKIVDFDGTIAYSNIINIQLADAVVDNFVNVYPNPTDGLLNVEIQATADYNTRLSVYDVLGKVVFEDAKDILKGLNTLQFNFATLAKGTYIIRFADGAGKVHTTKFVKD